MAKRKNKQKPNSVATLQPKPITPVMLTIKEAADFVPGLTKHRIRLMCINGTLPHIRAGNRYLINRTALLVAIGEITR